MNAQDRLQAYHDGELAGLARWRFERRLRRDPALQRELAALRRVGDWVRATHREVAGEDLWDAIAMRLPAADARRADPDVGSAAGGRSPGVGWLALPGAVAAGVAVAFAMGWFAAAPARETAGVVRWLDGGGRDVMVLEGEPDTTIIWVLEGSSTGAGRGERLESV